MLLDFDDLKASQRYHWMANTIVPRPIAWVATEGETGNIAPFSYFSPLSSEPATVVVSIGHRRDGTPKDTLRNLREQKRCAICIVDERHFSAMHLSSKDLSSEQSEFEVFGIESDRIIEGYPAVPQGAKIVLFGSYLQEVDLPGSKTVPVVISIEHLFVDDAIVDDEEQAILSFDAIARVGRNYRALGEEMSAPDIP